MGQSADQNANGSEELFAGVSAFFLQKVPTRQKWISLFEEHGGRKVDAEKQADLVIADHARKDAPLGSISWRYIDECVKKSQRLRPEGYPAGPVAGRLRVSESSTSSRPVKGTRNPFSSADDQFLLAYLRDHGHIHKWQLFGNGIFKDLAEEHQGHTYQSWRDRYVKYLSKSHSIEQLQAAAPNPSSQVSSTPKVPKQSQQVEETPVKKIQVKKERVTPKTIDHAVSSRSSARSLSPKPAGLVFSAEDVVLIEGEDLYESIKKTAMISAERLARGWKQFAAAHPQHTADEWRMYWEEVVEPRGLGGSSAITPSTEKAKSKVTPDIGTAKSEKSQIDTVLPASRKEIEETPVPKVAPSARAVRESVVKSANDDIPKEEESTFPSSAPQEIQQFVNKAVKLTKEMELLDDSVKEAFERVVQLGEHVLDLAEIWHVLNDPGYGFEGFNRVEDLGGWELFATAIAESYGIEIAIDMAAPKLQLLCQVLNDFDEASKAGLITEDTIGADAFAPVEIETSDIDLDIDTPVPSRKRRISVDQEKEHIQPSASSSSASPNKRRMLNKGKEKQDVTYTPKSSAGNSHRISSTDPRQDTTPRKETRKHTVTEPETQDFHFSVPPDLDIISSSIHDSQDLHFSQPGTEPPSSDPRAALEDESTQSQTDSQNEAELSQYIDHWVALGYAEEVVRDALRATTMTIENASIVMESLAKGQGIPQDAPGVWTEEEDQAIRTALQGKQTMEYFWLFDKHGEVGVSKREKFLRDIHPGLRLS